MSNVITLTENEILKIQKVKTYFNIPNVTRTAVSQTISKGHGKKSFNEAFSEGIFK